MQNLKIKGSLKKKKKKSISQPVREKSHHVNQLNVQPVYLGHYSITSLPNIIICNIPIESSILLIHTKLQVNTNKQISANKII